jgi:hypothetical protein
MVNIVRSEIGRVVNCSEGFGVVGLCVGGGDEWGWETEREWCSCVNEC